MSAKPDPIGRAQAADFLQPGHRSGGFELTLAIVRQFAGVATERGKRVMVLMLPEEETILCHRRNGTWTYGDLITAMVAEGVPVLDIGDAFERHLGPNDPGTLFEARQHYNNEGYKAMADAVAPALIEMSGDSITAAGR